MRERNRLWAPASDSRWISVMSRSVPIRKTKNKTVASIDKSREIPIACLGQPLRLKMSSQWTTAGRKAAVSFISLALLGAGLSLIGAHEQTCSSLHDCLVCCVLGTPFVAPARFRPEPFQQFRRVVLRPGLAPVQVPTVLAHTSRSPPALLSDSLLAPQIASVP